MYSTKDKLVSQIDQVAKLIGEVEQVEEKEEREKEEKEKTKQKEEAGKTEATATQPKKGEQEGIEIPQILTLNEDLRKVRVSLRVESLRMRNILLPQLFRLHEMDGSLEELARMDPANFRYIQAAFSHSLEATLSEFTKEQLENLKNPEGRLVLYRKLYQQLLADPQIDGSLQSFWKNYNLNKLA